MVKLTPESCRAARALLGWSVAKLVKEAEVSPNTVTKIEAGGDARDATSQRIVATFEAHGVEILNGDAPGARIAKR